MKNNLHVSTLNTIKRCARYYHNKYNLKLKSLKCKVSLLVGRAFAKALEDKTLKKDGFMDHIYNLETELIDGGIDIKKAKEEMLRLKTIFCEYILKYRDEWSEYYPEYSTSTVVEIEGVQYDVNCKVDLLAKHKDGRWFVIDQKTASEIDAHDSISTRLQPAIYPFVIMQEKGINEVTFLYDVIKKINGQKKCKLVYEETGEYKVFKSGKQGAAIKIKRLETFEEYEERIKIDYQEKAETNYKRVPFVIKNDSKLHEKVLLEIMNYLHQNEFYEATKYYPCTELACDLYGGCEYKEYCYNDFNLTDNYKFQYEYCKDPEIFSMFIKSKVKLLKNNNMILSDICDKIKVDSYKMMQIFKNQVTDIEQLKKIYLKLDSIDIKKDTEVEENK